MNRYLRRVCTGFRNDFMMFKRSYDILNRGIMFSHHLLRKISPLSYIPLMI
jgi:hypothetical protein